MTAALERTTTNQPLFSEGMRLFSLLALLALTIAPTFDEINADTFKSILIAVGAFAGLWMASRRRSVLAGALDTITRWREPSSWVAIGAALMLAHAVGSMAWASFIPAAKEAARWVVFFAIFMLAQSSTQPHDISRTLVRLSLASLVVSTFGMIQFFYGLNIFPQTAEPASSFINRNFAAEVVACLMWTHLYVARRCQTAQGAAWYGAQFGLAAVYIVTCATRSAMLSTALLGALYLGWTFARSPKALKVSTLHALGGALALAVGLLAFTSSAPSFEGDRYHALAMKKWASTSLTGDEDGSASIRKEILVATVKAAAQSAPLGLGAGALGEHLIDFQETKGGYEVEDYAHNEYLQWMAEYGLVGAAFSLALLSFALFRVRAWTTKTGQSDSATEETGHLLAMLGALLVVMALGFPVHLTGGLALLALVTGFLNQPWRLPSCDRAKLPPSSTPAERTAYLILAGLSLYIGIVAASTEWSLNTSRKISLQVQSYLSGMSDDMKKYRTEASNMADEALPWAKWNHRVLGLTADELASIGEFATAKALYEEYLAVRPKSAGTWVSLAKIAQIEGDDKLFKEHLAMSLAAQRENMPALTMLANRDATRGVTSAAKDGFMFLLGMSGTRPAGYDKGYRITDEFFHSSCIAFAQKTTDTALLEACRQHRAKYSENGFMTVLEMAQEQWQKKEPGAQGLFVKGLRAAPKARRKEILKQVPKAIAKEVAAQLTQTGA